MSAVPSFLHLDNRYRCLNSTFLPVSNCCSSTSLYSHLIEFHRNMDVLRHLLLLVFHLASFLVVVLKSLILLVKIFLDIFFQSSRDCLSMEISCLNNEGSSRIFHNGRKLIAPNIFELRRAGQVRFIRGTLDYRQSAIQECSQQPKYQSLLNM